MIPDFTAAFLFDILTVFESGTGNNSLFPLFCLQRRHGDIVIGLVKMRKEKQVEEL